MQGRVPQDSSRDEAKVEALQQTGPSAEYPQALRPGRGANGRSGLHANHHEGETMLRARTMSRLAMALMAGVLMVPMARAQEKPKDTPAAATQARAADAAKEANKEPAPPKPRIAFFPISGAAKET